MKSNPLIPLVAFGLMALLGVVGYENRAEIRGWIHHSNPSPAPAPTTNPDDTVRAALATFFDQAGDKWNAHTYTVASSQQQWQADQKAAFLSAAQACASDDLQPVADACTTKDATGKRSWNPNATEESIGAACKQVAQNLKN